MMKMRLGELESETGELRKVMERRQECHARLITDLDDRVAFIGRFLCVGLFLSVIAVVMAVLF